MSGGRSGGHSGGVDALTAVRRWLEPRLAEVPPPLARAVLAGVEAAPGSVDPGASVPEVLARVALGGLESAVGGPQNRDGALSLLAADAMLTYAFEAAADLNADPVGLADRVGVRGALGQRLREVGSPARPDGE